MNRQGLKGAQSDVRPTGIIRTLPTGLGRRIAECWVLAHGWKVDASG